MLLLLKARLFACCLPQGDTKMPELLYSLTFHSLPLLPVLCMCRCLVCWRGVAWRCCRLTRSGGGSASPA